MASWPITSRKLRQLAQSRWAPVSQVTDLSRRFRLILLVGMVAAATAASIVTLGYSVQSIQQALPIAHLMKERDFSALQRDMTRLEFALDSFQNRPQADTLDALRLALDIVVFRSQDNLKLHGANDPRVRQYVTDLTAAVAVLDPLLQAPGIDRPGVSLQELTAVVAGERPRWSDLAHRATVLNDDVFQASIEGVTEQGRHLQSLRAYLIVFIGLTAVGAGVLAVSLVRQQLAFERLRRLDEEVRELAFQDPLTKLANRRLLMDRLHRYIEQSTRGGQYGALVYLDLDHFKSLNDTQGHAAGDELLALIARRLSKSVRTVDTVARVGGDEFVVLVEDLGTEPDAAARGAEAVATKIHATLSQPFQLRSLDGFVWQGSVSIGVSTFSGRQHSAEAVIKQADMALYQAKDSGRDAIRFFDPDMQRALEVRVQMERDLRKAVETQSFAVLYQPVVTPDGSVVGAEALVRWRREAQAPVAPAAFIALAEETGLIVPLGRWILQTACQQWVAWQATLGRPDLRLAVNVSGRQIRQPDFVADVVAVLQRTGLNPRSLTLEVTESVILSNLEDTQAKLGSLRAMGVGLAMDDFGTGYSSLTYLQQLPFTEIKIDRSFVHDIGVDPGDEAICAATVALARRLGLGVVVEGVETERQREFFRLSNPCDLMQGYLFSPPLDAASFLEWARRPRAAAPLVLPSLSGSALTEAPGVAAR